MISGNLRLGHPCVRFLALLPCLACIFVSGRGGIADCRLAVLHKSFNRQSTIENRKSNVLSLFDAPRDLAWTNATSPDGEMFDVKVFGAKGDGTTDDTKSIQDAINAATAGGTVYFPSGTYVVSGLTVSSTGIILRGPGTIKAKAKVDAVTLRISGDSNKVLDLIFDGTNPKPTPNYLNDIIGVTGSKNTIAFVTINTSQGSGIMLRGGENIVAHNKIYNILGNYGPGIYASGVGADRNLIMGNLINGTRAGNCIFITASADSSPTPNFVYDNVVIGNTLRACGDSGIESSTHAVRTVIQGNSVDVPANAGILVRDGTSVLIDSNILNMETSAHYDAIGIAALNEPASWDNRLKVSNNVIRGYIKRSGIYSNQGGLNAYNNDIEDTSRTVGPDGSGLGGTGIICGVGPCFILGNRIKRVAVGIDLNGSAALQSLSDIVVTNNWVNQVNYGLNLFRTTFTNSDFSSNFFSHVKTAGIATLAADGGRSSHLQRNTFALSGWVGANPRNTNSDITGFLTDQLASVCVSNTSPAVCGAATSGMVAIPTGWTKLTVETSTVTAHSQVFVKEDTTLGPTLSIAGGCDTNSGRTYRVTARTAGSDFEITASPAPTGKPACLSFWVVN